MRIQIDPSNGKPIYEQIVMQVKYAVAQGIALPGQVIPSVRELAKSLTLNPNTVQRAYMQLQEDEVLESLRGKGMSVAQGAKRKCVEDRKRVLTERIQSVVLEGISSGLDEATLRSQFDKALKSAQQTLGKES